MNTKNQLNSPPPSLSPAEAEAYRIGDLAYEAIKNNMPLYLLQGLKKEQMDALYTQGYYLYSQAKYKEAIQPFKALAFYNTPDQRGWLGLAGCYEMLKQYEQAIRFYSCATILKINDPIPPLHAFDCYIALKNYPKALSCLEAVIVFSSNKPEHAALKKRAESLKNALLQAMTEKDNS